MLKRSEVLPRQDPHYHRVTWSSKNNRKTHILKHVIFFSHPKKFVGGFCVFFFCQKWRDMSPLSPTKWRPCYMYIVIVIAADIRRLRGTYNDTWLLWHWQWWLSRSTYCGMSNAEIWSVYQLLSPVDLQTLTSVCRPLLTHVNSCSATWLNQYKPENLQINIATFPSTSNRM